MIFPESWQSFVHQYLGQRVLKHAKSKKTAAILTPILGYLPRSFARLVKVVYFDCFAVFFKRIYIIEIHGKKLPHVYLLRGLGMWKRKIQACQHIVKDSGDTCQHIILAGKHHNLRLPHGTPQEIAGIRALRGSWCSTRKGRRGANPQRRNSMIHSEAREFPTRILVSMMRPGQILFFLEAGGIPRCLKWTKMGRYTTLLRVVAGGKIPWRLG